jgi:hypothetical protein
MNLAVISRKLKQYGRIDLAFDNAVDGGFAV